MVHSFLVQSAEEIDVFAYRDYRSFLADTYEHRKKSEYGFSYRAFSRRAGLSAPNYLKLVTDGQRNLTNQMAVTFAEALGLKSEAANYFCDLVAFNQAENASLRERCYTRLQSYRRYRNAFRLDAAHAAYHSEWYIPVVRELVVCCDFVDDPQWIARILRPKISPKEVTRALRILEELGFIVRDDAGQWSHKEPLLATGEEQPLGHNLANFHRMMLNKAAESLDTTPRGEREFGALTLALNEEQVARFKRRLFELREEFFQESCSEEGQPDRVVQIGFQLFPLSEVSKRSEES